MDYFNFRDIAGVAIKRNEAIASLDNDVVHNFLQLYYTIIIYFNTNYTARRKQVAHRHLPARFQQCTWHVP